MYIMHEVRDKDVHDTRCTWYKMYVMDEVHDTWSTWCMKYMMDEVHDAWGKWCHDSLGIDPTDKVVETNIHCLVSWKGMKEPVQVK